jgi:hypothetical protein
MKNKYDYFVENHKVLEFNIEDFDPNGDPIVVELTIEEHQQILDLLNKGDK